MKDITILGATGSIGVQTLDVVRRHPDHLGVRGLSAHQNARRLVEQALEFRPKRVAIGNVNLSGDVAQALEPLDIEVLAGDEGLQTLARCDDADMVVAAIAGFSGMAPTLAAVEAGIDVAIANKEAVVCAGPLLMEAAQATGSRIIPVDSEHNALFQCLIGETTAEVERLVLTASGGPFWDRTRSDLKWVTPADALAHPRWEMGQKISVDSATMMNKGLEIIEARWLFDIPLDRIEVVVHPQSTVHSMVWFTDGSIKAQLGATDMRYAIQHALSYPARWGDPGYALFSLFGCQLDFARPDEERFPCLAMAREAGVRGGLYPTLLVSADEVAVDAFLKEKIPFTMIADIIRTTLARWSKPKPKHYDIDAVYDAADWAKKMAAEIVGEVTN